MSFLCGFAAESGRFSWSPLRHDNNGLNETLKTFHILWSVCGSGNCRRHSCVLEKQGKNVELNLIVLNGFTRTGMYAA